ncbi:unnamed protein product [Brugia pahangi]|uniref:V-SNARE coiled-coil homology domain-containing protein n=1 Tax=Brugia pahangi TaxID=6280 RepID=A0A0N4TTA6_BRUPA|nr:unnamed protein product [Brugia pahangi]
MIDMLARVQRMCEITKRIDSGTGMIKKYERNIQLGNRSDTDLNHRLSSCCFRFASFNRSSNIQQQLYELVYPK